MERPDEQANCTGNSNSESRNTKQIRISKKKKSETVPVAMDAVLNISCLDFEFVSYFDIRISCFSIRNSLETSPSAM